MLEQRELDRVRGMAAALIRRATVECDPEAGAPDAESFAQLVGLIAELSAQLPAACTALRQHHGTSWAEIGDALGVTRSAAQKRFGQASNDHLHDGSAR